MLQTTTKILKGIKGNDQKTLGKFGTSEKIYSKFSSGTECQQNFGHRKNICWKIYKNTLNIWNRFCEHFQKNTPKTAG